MSFAIVYCVDGNLTQLKMLRNSLKTAKARCPKAHEFVLTATSKINVDSAIVVDVNDLAMQYSIDKIKSTKRTEISNTTFLRFLVPIVPQLAAYDRILYLDNDTEIADSIDELFDISFEGHEILGCNELYPFSHIHANDYTQALKQKVLSTGLSIDNLHFRDNYFINGGVMLFNAAKLRHSSYSEKVKYALQLQNTCDFTNKDEDLMNIAFDIGLLDKCYNAFPNECISKKIVHYICHYKHELLERI